MAGVVEGSGPSSNVIATMLSVVAIELAARGSTLRRAEGILGTRATRESPRGGHRTGAAQTCAGADQQVPTRKARDPLTPSGGIRRTAVRRHRPHGSGEGVASRTE